MSAGAALQRIRDALESRGPVRESGGSLSACCPAHEDHTPSLSVRGIEGQVLVHCHAECATQDVLAALGLELRDLYDEPHGVAYRYDNGRIVHRSPEKKFYQGHTDQRPELYRLAKVREAVVEGRTVYVVEGEKDADAAASIGLAATCSPMGAGKWGKINPSPLYGATVVVVADDDEPGMRHAAEVYESLKGHAHVAIVKAAEGKDLADHIAAGHGAADLVPVPEPTPAAPLDDGLGGQTINLAAVTAEHVDWLWQRRLPLGKLVVLDGDPAVGKSTLAVDCAARVSTGRAWPDDAPCRQAAVLLLSAEDGLADTIRPRLDAAGADPAMVNALTEVAYLDDGGSRRTRPPTLADLDEIEKAVQRTRAALVVVDVLMAYLPGKVDSHRDQDVRGVLAGLAAMAERNGCCVLLLRHLNKSSGGSAMYRGGGSIGIIGAARVGLLAAVDPDDETRRVLAPIKANLSAAPEALAYQLADAPEHGCARVQWLGASQHSAGELLTNHGEDGDDADELVSVLRVILDDARGEIAAAEAFKRLRSFGANPGKSTLARARKRAGIETRKADFGSGWVWRYADEGSTGHAQGSEGSTPSSPGTLGTFAEPSPQTARPEPTSTPVGASPARQCRAHPDAPVTTDGKCPLCVLDAIAAQAPAHAYEPGCQECDRRKAFRAVPCPAHREREAS